MIEVQGLTKFYGALPAIQDVSFRVEAGEIVGFLGPNGAGKTTTMRILTGFAPPSAGTARIDGFDVRERPVEVKRRVGYLPENVPLYPEMRVRKFLKYVAEVKGIPREIRLKETDRALERCGLSEVADRIIRNLSKGYRQRVGLAQALLGNPPVLILDEPTVGLDPRQIIEIRRMIQSLAPEHTVLLSTHILPEVAMICRRVVIIHRGRVVAQDALDNLAGGRSGQFRVEVSGSLDKAEQALKAVPGVRRVERGDGGFLVHAPEPGAREKAARAVVEAGVGLRRLEPRERTLEDVFVEAISTEEREGAA